MASCQRVNRPAMTLVDGAHAIARVLSLAVARDHLALLCADEELRGGTRDG